MMKTALAPIRFIRLSMRGYWMHPWRSPYLRWRMETYSGIPAETIDAHLFWEFMASEKWRLLHFLRWTAEIDAYTKPKFKSQ
jgi:hypothetical protein